MTAAVVDTLPLLASAPGGAPRLRNLILDLAANRRLGSADVEWRATQLRELVVSSGAGWSPSCDGRARLGDEWGVLKVSAVTWGQFQPGENKALPNHLEPRPELEVQPGDFLISRANTADLVARSVVVEHTPPKLMLSDKIVRLRLSDACDPRFVQIVNSSPEARRYYARVAGGTSSSMKNVSREQILALRIRLPPLPEQHRIVAKVDELMALCDRLEARQQDADAAHARLVQALLDSLTQARDADEFRACWHRLAERFAGIFSTEQSVLALEKAIHTFALRGLLTESNELPASGSIEGPHPIPAAWTWQTLSDVTSVLTDGEHLTPQRTQDRSQIPLATAKNVRNGYIDLADTDFVTHEVAERCWLRCRPAAGDVLMVSVGATLGRLSVLREQRDMVIVRSVALFRPRSVDPDYLALALRSPLLQDEIWSRVKQSAQPCLYLSQAKQLQIPVPPLGQQLDIVAKVIELLALCDQLKARIAAARAKHAQLAEALVAQAVAA